MPQGISKNPLTDISKVYLDKVSEARLKSLEKASVLDASDDPNAQDEARRIRVMHDYADLKKQQKKMKKKVVAEEKCECNGCGEDTCVECGENCHEVAEDYETKKRGEVLSALKRDKRPLSKKEKEKIAADIVKKKGDTSKSDDRYAYEGFSDWREDLREIVGSASPSTMTGPDKVSQQPGKSLHTTSDRNSEKITEKKVKNKIKINPEFKEAVESIGGQLLEVKEIEPEVDGEPSDPLEDKKAEQQKKKEQQLKKRIIRMKMMAVNSGNDQGIVASYQPEIDGAVQYFYEQGINAEGLDQIIEEIGLDEFVEFVLDASQFLTEETEEGRPARKMNVRTLKSTKKKAAEIKADRSDVVKRGTPVDTLRRARAERSTKKPKLAKPAKPAVVKSVEKVKKTQPAKKPNKQSLRDRVGSAFKKGVERHKAAVSKNEFTKSVASGVKAVGKAVRDVDSVLKVNKKTTVNMQSYEPEGDFIDEDTKRTTKGRWIDKKGRSHKFAVTTHTGDEKHVGEIVKSQYPAKRVVITGQAVDKKKAPKKKEKVEEEVGISSTEKMQRARREALLKAKEEAAVARKKKTEKQKAKERKGSVSARKNLTAAQLRKYDTDGDGKVRVVNASYDPLSEDRSAFKKAVGKVFGQKKKEREAKKAQDAGARARRVLQRREYADKVSGSTDNVPDEMRESDQAFQNVVARLKAKHGDGVLSSKQDFEDHKKREAAKPKPKPKKDTRTPEQKKADQYKANMDAVYGGPQRDRGLGT